MTDADGLTRRGLFLAGLAVLAGAAAAKCARLIPGIAPVEALEPIIEIGEPLRDAPLMFHGAPILDANLARNEMIGVSGLNDLVWRNWHQEIMRAIDPPLVIEKKTFGKLIAEQVEAIQQSWSRPIMKAWRSPDIFQDSGD